MVLDRLASDIEGGYSLRPDAEAETPAPPEAELVCRVCHASSGHSLFRAREMMFGFADEFVYFQCASCECLQIRDIPQDLSRYYPPSYYSFAGVPRRTGFRDFTTRVRHRYANRYALFGEGVVGRMLYRRSPNTRLRTLARAGLTRRSRVLDVGSGAGVLLETLREAGIGDVLGVDPFLERDIRRPNGVTVLKRTIDDVDGGWSLILFQHSFEHVEEPEATLRSAAARLLPDGVCVIRMPTVSSYAWHHYREDWVQLDAPRHLCIQSLRSMSLLAARTGLVVSHVEFESSAFQFWGSEQYRRGIPLRSPESHAVNPRASTFTATEIREFEARAGQLNRQQHGDEISVFLTRQPMSDDGVHPAAAALAVNAGPSRWS